MWQSQDVADSAPRLDQRGLLDVDLASQVGDVGLDDARLTAEVVVPDMVEDLGLGQHPVGVEHEVAQQLELGRGNLDGAMAASYLVGVLVELEVVKAQGGVTIVLAPGPSEHSADPGDHLFEAERLGDVVVTSDGQTLDLVLDRVSR